MTNTEQYTIRREEIENEIRKLQENLKNMDAQQKKDARNWGFSGNCGHVLNQLKELNGFMA